MNDPVRHKYRLAGVLVVGQSHFEISAPNYLSEEEMHRFLDKVGYLHQLDVAPQTIDFGDTPHIMLKKHDA